jgi:hypothetical protein
MHLSRIMPANPTSCLRFQPFLVHRLSPVGTNDE